MTAVAMLVALLQLSAVSSRYGYRFPLPEGFVPFREGRAQRDIVDCWTEVVPVSPTGALVLCVQRMHGRLGRERMKPADMPANSQLLTYQWKGFPIDGLRTDTLESGNPIVIFSAQVPLRREAVQLFVAGPRDQWRRAEAILASTLGSLEGETNWLTAEERAGRFGHIFGWVVGITLAAILVRMWRTRQQAKHA